MSASKETIGLTLVLAISSVILTLVSGVVDWNVQRVTTGLLIFLVLGMIRIIWILGRVNMLNGKLFALMDSLSNLEDNFSELAFVTILMKIRKYQNGRLEVGEDKDDILTFWYESISRINTSYEALSYALPDETWMSGWNKIALGIQQERIAHRCRIERIFVLSDKDDLADYQSIFAEQKEIGIRVGWVRKSDLQGSKIVRSYLKRMETNDFAIIDQRWTHRTFLRTRSRSIISSDATKDKNILKRAKFIYQEARKRAEFV